MGNLLYLNILPFNPYIEPDGRKELPIDLDDLVKRLAEAFSFTEIRTYQDEDSTNVVFYITNPLNEPWVMVDIIAGKPTQFIVQGLPKQLAKNLVLWFRMYVRLEHPLFAIYPDSGDMIELTEHTTADDLEIFYPHPISDDWH